MGMDTHIEWADDTVNFWFGCTAVSHGCDNCYAENWTRRFDKAKWGNFPRVRAGESNWKAPYAYDRKAARDGKPRLVFTNSLSDFFDNQVPEEWRAEAWQIIADCENLRWLILTKRPQNIDRMLPANWGGGWSHVWLGISAEDQTEYDRRWPILAEIPAAIRFVSYEPALGPLTLSAAGDIWPNWIIFGGESGPGKRRVDLAWARDMRAQCAARGIAFFMKQVDKVRAIPADLMIREYPG
jgi:protein gp37